MSRSRWLAAVLVLGPGSALPAADKTPVEQALAREVIGPRQALLDLQQYLQPRIPRLPAVRTAAGWDVYARRIRGEVLDRVVFRGEARKWRDARVKVDWLETIPGGPGYRIRKLRYEALPGLWVPALLYEPERKGGGSPPGK